MTQISTLLKTRARPGMIVVTDVDGVHTSRDGGAKITAKPGHASCWPRFEYSVGAARVLELVVQSSDTTSASTQMVWGGFDHEEICEIYQFHTPDGQGILSLQDYGLTVLVVSGRNAAPVRDRFERKLKADTHLGVRDKLEYFSTEHSDGPKLDLRNVIFISDGHQDAPLLRAVSAAGGIAVATADAEPEAMAAADAVTVAKGGEGAFAELAATYLAWLYGS